MSDDVLNTVTELQALLRESNTHLATERQTVEILRAQLAAERERADRAEAKLEALGGVCPHCNGRADLPPGHIERCYCLPAVRRQQKHIADLEAALAEAKADVERLDLLEKERQEST